MKKFILNFTTTKTKKLSIIIFLIILIIYFFSKDISYIPLEQHQGSSFEEILSFENNLNLTELNFEEFRKINSENKLIDENNIIETNKNPDITVIMTIYNQAHCIYKGLRSIQNQSIKNIEIIIIDDCSLDNSTEVIKEYQKEDPRIILISHDSNEGTIKSRTDGIKIAKGKYITIIDGDDALIYKDILKHSLFIALKANIDAIEFKHAIFSEGRIKKVINDYNFTNITNIIYQPELRTKFIWIKEKTSFYNKNRLICGKLIKNELFKKMLTYIGDEYTNDYIIEAEDTIMAVSLFHLANSYYIMKEVGYFYSFRQENKYGFPKIKNKICKVNNKLKINYGRIQYIKFFIEKGIRDEKEKASAFNEITKIDHTKYFEKTFDKRIYKTMIYIYDKISEFGNLTGTQKKYILDLKSKATQKIKENLR